MRKSEDGISMNLLICPEEDCKSKRYTILVGRTTNDKMQLSYDVVCAKCGEYMMQFWG